MTTSKIQYAQTTTLEKGTRERKFSRVGEKVIVYTFDREDQSTDIEFNEEFESREKAEAVREDRIAQAASMNWNEKETGIATDELSSVFFAPSGDVMFSLLRYLYTMETEGQYSISLVDDYTSPEKIAGVIVQRYYKEYCAAYPQWAGALNMQNMIETLREYQLAFKQRSYFQSPTSYMNAEQKEAILNKIKMTTCSSSEDTLFAVGKLNEDLKSCDADCYETAGGYRNFIARKDTVCRFYLTSSNKIYMTYESSCIEDHYNNNFFGNSTGGGNNKYEEGQRTEIRTHHFGAELFSEILKSGIARVIKADYDKAKAICEANIANA